MYHVPIHTRYSYNNDILGKCNLHTYIHTIYIHTYIGTYLNVILGNLFNLLFYFSAMNEKRCRWSRGKVLGGSSVSNNMLYARGNPIDFENWEKQGNSGWGYNDVLQYFKKSEDNKDSSLVRTPYHSAGGYLTVSEAPANTPLAEAFMAAGREMGYNVHDINGQRQTGLWYHKAPSEMVRGAVRRRRS